MDENKMTLKDYASMVDEELIRFKYMDDDEKLENIPYVLDELCRAHYHMFDEILSRLDGE